MKLSPVLRCVQGALLPGAMLCSAPLYAETLEQLDALSDLAVDEAAGIDAARAYAGRGEYLDALATLERVLAVHPRSHEARLIHALYLCRIDDRQGGMVELGELKNKHYGDDLLDEARAMCARGGAAQ